MTSPSPRYPPVSYTASPLPKTPSKSIAPSRFWIGWKPRCTTPTTRRSCPSGRSSRTIAFRVGAGDGILPAVMRSASHLPVQLPDLERLVERGRPLQRQPLFVPGHIARVEHRADVGWHSPLHGTISFRLPIS